MATKYLTAGHNNSPYITTYSQSGSTFTKLSNPTDLPGATVYSVHWNYNATSLAVATFVTSPYVIVYNVAADVFTKIAEFTELSGSLTLAWSPDGSKLVLGDIASPYIRIYNRSGDTFTQVSDPGTLPTGAAQGLSWSPDGNKLAVAHSTSPFVTVYQVSGDTFTKVSNPGTLPYGEGYAVAWNPTSDVLAVGATGTSSIYPGRVYNYSSNTLSYVSDIGSPGTGVLIQRDGLAWRPNGNQLAVMSNQASVIYNKSGNTYSSSGANITLAGTAGPVEWDNFGNTIAIGHTSSPYISIYNQVSDSGFVKFANPGTLPTSSVRSLTWAFATGTQSGNLSVSSAFTTTGLANRSRQSALTITSTSTISSLGDRIRYAAVSMQAFDTVLYVGNKIISASVTINGITTISASGNKFVNAQSDINSLSTVSAVGRLAITHSGAVSTNSTATLVSDTVRIRPGDINVTSTAQLTANGVKSSDVSTSINSTASISARLGRVVSASTSITAFNTVVSATLRIRPGVDLTDSQAVMSVSAGRIRPGRSVYIDPQAPTGIIVDSTHITSIPAFYNITGQSSAYITSGYTVAGYTYTGGDYNNANNVEGSGYGSLETFLPVKEISFWLNCPASNQVIWSTAMVSGYSSNGHRSLVFSRTGTGFKLVYKEWTGYDLTVPTVNNTLTWAQAIGAGWNHILLSFSYGGEPITATLYINGDNIGTGSGSPPSSNGTKLANPIILGAEQRVTGDPGSSSRTYDYINTSSDFEIAQFWAGRMGFGISNPSLEIYNVTGAWTGSQGYRNLGSSGKDGVNERFETVYFYNELDYPYALGRTSPGDARPTILNRFQLVGDSYITTDDSYKPGWLARTPTTFADEIIPYYPARFRLFALGGQVLGGELIVNSSFELTATATDFTKAQAALSSAATLTALSNYAKFANASLTFVASITARISQVLSSSATLSSAFTLTADPDEISGGILLSLGSFSLTSAGTVIRDARTSVASAATLTATAADKNMGEAVLFSAFSLSAVPRVVLPVRPEAMTMSAAFSVSPTSNRFRDSLVPLASAWTFANGVTRAIRSSVVTMSAFDTVLSAGKIIEFLAENTIAVTEEQRRLRVALESTVLLVQMANGVNTITAETTDIVVPQEQGRLLAQYNTPTN